MIGLPAGTRIWIAAGVTDMRCGFQGLAGKVETALQESPFSGHRRRDVRGRHRHRLGAGRRGADHRRRRVRQHRRLRKRRRWPPPGPLAKAALKTPCSSVAWSLVSLPEETSLEIRSSILDLMSPGWLLLDWSLERLDWIEESMSVSAEDSASWSVEETAPDVTWDCNSACSFCRGDW